MYQSLRDLLDRQLEASLSRDTGLDMRLPTSLMEYTDPAVLPAMELVSSSSILVLIILAGGARNMFLTFLSKFLRSPLGRGLFGLLVKVALQSAMSLPSLTVLTCLFIKITWSRQLINDYNVLLESSHLPSGPHQFLLETLDLADEFGLQAELEVVECHVVRDVQ